MSERYLQVQTTTDSRADAERLARSLVQARVAACTQVLGPITSAYWWEGQVETGEEWLLLAKTAEGVYPRLERHVRAQHSYDEPEIIATPITHGSNGYLDWVATETQSDRQPG